MLLPLHDPASVGGPSAHVLLACKLGAVLCMSYVLEMSFPKQQLSVLADEVALYWFESVPTHPEAF